MRSHGQAQLANDLLTAQAPARYGVTAVGYGPGSADTNIRRELSRLARAVMKPFYAVITRTPEQVAIPLAGILTDATLDDGTAYWYGKKGAFPAATFTADLSRQQALIRASTALARKALTDQPHRRRN